jgi:hypothetical protein
MRMNQDYADECPIMIKNQMQTQLSFFDFWNFMTNHYGMGA